MTPKEFHEACHDACLECPQFSGYDDDPGITDLCQEIRNYLLIPPSVLRNNSHTRAVTSGHAQRILIKTLTN